MLAMHKMNTFHWHLTDDQGWRIEIKKYPKLTEIGSKRKETLVDYYYVNYPQVFDGKEHGGYYTQEQIKACLLYTSPCGRQHLRQQSSAKTFAMEREYPISLKAALTLGERMEGKKS